MKNIILVLNQRKVVWLLAIFLSLILFNTTYRNLGTYVPLVVIFISLFHINFRYKITISNYKGLLLVFVLVTLFSTILSEGDFSRDVPKIFITILIYIAFSSIYYSE